MSWSAPLRSPRAMHRLAAFLLALIWVTAPVLAVFHSHSSAEVHRYCAEHRALEDVQGDSDGSADAGADVGADVGRDQPVASESDIARLRGVEPARPHSGCVFARFCRSGDLLSGFFLETARVLEPTLVPAPVVRAVTATVAVIVVAPKTSPPV